MEEQNIAQNKLREREQFSSLVLISCRPPCDIVTTDNVQRSVPVGLRRICDGPSTRSNFAQNANRIGAIFNIPPVNMDRIIVLEYVASANDIHIKYFHRQQSLTTTGSHAKLN